MSYTIKIVCNLDQEAVVRGAAEIHWQALQASKRRVASSGGLGIAGMPLRADPPRAQKLVPDPLDVEADGVPLRDLLQRDRDNCQGDRLTKRGVSAWRLTTSQRAAVSAHWSAEFRAKVAVRKAADAEHEARRVLVDLEDE